MYGVMALYQKSAGFLQYEKDVAEIADRVRAGDFTDRIQIMEKFDEAIIRNAPNMTGLECARFADRSPSLLEAFANVLVKQCGAHVAGMGSDTSN
jgi:hypothetical protein